jgi:uncharacterized damage-inducible protein DinB
MTTIDLLRTLYDYNYWAHRQVWQTSITALTDEQFTQPLDYSVGSIHQQVVHTMSAEWMWLTRLGGTSPAAMLDPADYPTRPACRARWDEIEAEAHARLDSLADADLNDDFSYTTTSGKTYTQSTAEILLHVVNHGTDHRAQMLAMLHRFGVPTVQQDLIFYMRERG